MRNKLIKISSLLVLVFAFLFTTVNVSAHECEDCTAVDQEAVVETLEDAYELLEEYGPQVVAAFEEEVNEFLSSEEVQAILALVAEKAELIGGYLHENAVYAFAALEDALEDKLAEYEGKDCEYIVKDVLVNVEAAAEEVNAALALLEKAAAPYIALAVDFYNQVKENDFYVEEALAYIENATYGYVTVENVLEVLEHAGHLLSTQVEYAQRVLDENKAVLEAYIAELVAELEVAYNEYAPEVVAELEVALAEAEALYAELVAELEVFEAEVKAYLVNLQAEVEAYLADLHEQVVAKVEEVLAQIQEEVEVLVAKIEAAYIEATTGSYETSADSYYVALGDSSATGNSYVEALASNLNLVEGMYNNLAVEGMRVEDLAYILTGVAGDAYYDDKFADLAEDYIAAIEAADIITLGFNNVDFVSVQLGELVPYALDWNRFFDAKLVAVVENLFAELDAELTQVLGDFKSTVLTLVSSFVYNYYGSLYYYPTVVEAIAKINPEALVVSLGMYNPFQGLTFEVEGTVVALGDYIDGIMAVINQYHVLTGMKNAFTVSVDVNGVETEYQAIVAENDVEAGLVELATLFLTTPEVFLPSEAGHNDIANRICAQLTLSCAHVAEQEDGDCTTPVHCVFCGEVVVEGAESHTAVVIPAVETTCSKAGSTEGSKCSVCGTILVAPEEVAKLDHTYDNTCDVDCNECGASRTPGDHEYDNNCDELCNICGGKRRTLGHVFGEWTVSKEATKKEEGQEYRACIHCNEIEIRSIAKLPSNGGTVAIIVSSSVVGVGGAGFAGYWFIFRKRLPKVVK